jgi:glycine betaine/choline ABC-type transport system substrate-binding protein
MAAGNWWGEPSVRDATDGSISERVSLQYSAWSGTIAVGSGSDAVSMLLGRILQLALAAEGFRVVDLVGMGSTNLVRQALLDADVDLIWWSGVDDRLAVLADEIPSIVLPTSAIEGWRLVVSSSLAAQLDEPSISGLAAWYGRTGETLRYTTVSEFDDESFEALMAAYGLTDSVKSLTQAEALEEVEALLKFGAVDAVIVGSLEETLTLSGFLAIDDDLLVLEQSPISMVVQQAIVEENAQVRHILEVLGDRLTSDVLHNLMSRIRSLRKDVGVVAREFLQQEPGNGD